MRRLGIAVLVVGLSSAPVRARASEPFLVNPTAQGHYELAGAYAANGDLRSAAAELDAAHAIEPHPDLLFIRAELRRQLQEYQVALKLYRAFLATTPSEAATAQALAGIAACEQALAALAPAPTSEPAPAVDVAPPAAPPSPPRDPLKGALLGLGLVGVAATVGLVAAAVDSRADVERATHSEYDDQRRRSLALQWAGGSLAVVSTGLLVGALVRHRVVARRGRGWTAWFTGDAIGAAVGGRF